MHNLPAPAGPVYRALPYLCPLLMYDFLTTSPWPDYELIDSGNFQKLERFGPYLLARPEPQAIWDPHLPLKEWEKADAAFARATHVVSLDLDNHRIVMNPMEPRGGVGAFDTETGRYTLHVSSQNIHINRNHVARVLGTEPRNLRFIAPDVGGGFGGKNRLMPEDIAVAVEMWTPSIVSV